MRLHVKRMPLQSVTVLPVKVMTRSVLNLVSKLWLLTLKIIAPWRDDRVGTMESRDAEIEYCKAHDIHLPFSADNSYSRDRNLWHISHEGLELEDPACEPNYDHLLVLGVSPEKAPDEAEYLTMTFEAGVPKTINGEEMKVADIIQ